MFLQVHDMLNMWKKSRADALVWIITFLTVVIIDIDYGLVIGIIASLILLLARSHTPSCSRLGNIPGTDVYLDVAAYQQVCQYNIWKSLRKSGLTFETTEARIIFYVIIQVPQ